MLGDGIGPEIVPASVRVVDAALAATGAEPVDWHELPLGASAIETHGSAIPAETMAALADLDGWLLGPHDSAAYPEPHRSRLNPSGALRKHFDLYANVRPARAFEGGRDRKSTRLNSSHANISYAVFCLKKKTTHPTPT